MLSPADAAVLARDPALPGLGLLLDEQALAERLGAPVRRRYLRYKPGTACVLGLDVGGARAYAVAHSSAARPKLDKTVATAPAGTLLAVDRRHGLLVARPAADRDLPALARLTADPARALARVLPGCDLSGARLTPLSYKPQRRWVGLLTRRSEEPAVVRVHRRADAASWQAVARALAAGPAGLTPAACTPALLGADARLGITALSWLPGTGLDALLAAGHATTEQVRAAGAAVAALHARPVGQLPVRGPEDDAADLSRAAAAVGDVVPALRQRSAALAVHLSEVLADRPAPVVTAHGDLSADQVVVGDDGRTGLVDLDAVTAAEAAFDLGGAVAALHASRVLGAGPADVEVTAARLLDGYDLPLDASRLQAHLAAGLLRRAVEPFRLCSARWPEQVGELLTLAEQASPVGISA